MNRQVGYGVCAPDPASVFRGAQAQDAALCAYSGCWFSGTGSGLPFLYHVARLMPIFSQGFERVSALARYSSRGSAIARITVLTEQLKRSAISRAVAGRFALTGGRRAITKPL